MHCEQCDAFNGFQPLPIITKSSILDVVAVLDPPLSKLVNLYANNLAGIQSRARINYYKSCVLSPPHVFE